MLKREAQREDEKQKNRQVVKTLNCYCNYREYL
jgi:hypothetical protein